jgi:hypothetical protein
MQQKSAYSAISILALFFLFVVGFTVVNLSRHDSIDKNAEVSGITIVANERQLPPVSTVAEISVDGKARLPLNSRTDRLGLNITIRNNSEKAFDFSPPLHIFVYDATFQTIYYQTAEDKGTLAAGPIPARQYISGTVNYNIPTFADDLELVFQPSYSTDSITIDL